MHTGQHLVHRLLQLLRLVWLLWHLELLLQHQRLLLLLHLKLLLLQLAASWGKELRREGWSLAAIYRHVLMLILGLGVLLLGFCESIIFTKVLLVALWQSCLIQWQSLVDTRHAGRSHAFAH